MSFHTIKTYSVTDHAETLKDLIASKQRRVDRNLGSSATEPQVVYGPIGQLVVKEVEEAPAPIKVGDVYKTRAGYNCRIVAADRRAVSPIVALVDMCGKEELCEYFEDGKKYLTAGSMYDLVLPTTRRKMVQFVPATPHDDTINLLPVVHQWDLGDYPGF